MRLLFYWMSAFSLMLAPSSHAASELVVGVLPYQPVRMLIISHTALATHLQQTLKRPVRLVTARDARVFGQRMLAGDYDLALAPAHLARLAQVDRGWHPLVRYVPDTPVLLLARRDAADVTPAALRGGALAVPDRNLLLVLAGERWLAQQGLHADRDYTVLETGSHAGALHALASGSADMTLSALAALQQTRGEDVRQVRIVREIGAIPLLVFVARNDMPAATRDTLKRALLTYRTPSAQRTVAVDRDDLAAMDIYLPLTRQRLQSADGAAVARQ